MSTFVICSYCLSSLCSSFCQSRLLLRVYGQYLHYNPYKYWVIELNSMFYAGITFTSLILRFKHQYKQLEDVTGQAFYKFSTMFSAHSSNFKRSNFIDQSFLSKQNSQLKSCVHVLFQICI